MLFTKTAILSAMAALASAYTQPDYNKSPSGNAITKPGLNDLVTAGKPYTIEWDPDTKGPISLVLLRGPSTNVQPIDTLAEAIDNSGHFDWTPSSELEPDTTHYGLMIVVEGSGQYQYSTQFGVKNEEYGNSASSASASASAPSSAPATTESAVSKGDGLHTIYSTEEFVTTRCPKCSAEASAASASATSTFAAPATTLSSIPVIGSTSSAAVSSSASVTPSSSSVAAATSTKASPSDAAAVTGSSSGSASSSAPSSVFTGAADRNTIGLGAVAAGMLAAFAF